MGYDRVAHIWPRVLVVFCNQKEHMCVAHRAVALEPVLAPLSRGMVSKSFLRDPGTCRMMYFSEDMAPREVERLQRLLAQHASPVPVVDVRPSPAIILTHCLLSKSCAPVWLGRSICSACSRSTRRPCPSRMCAPVQQSNPVPKQKLCACSIEERLLQRLLMQQAPPMAAVAVLSPPFTFYPRAPELPSARGAACPTSAHAHAEQLHSLLEARRW